MMLVSDFVESRKYECEGGMFTLEKHNARNDLFTLAFKDPQNNIEANTFCDMRLSHQELVDDTLQDRWLVPAVRSLIKRANS